VALAAIWEAVARSGRLPAGVLPPLTTVVAALPTVLTGQGLGQDVLTSLTEIAVGLVIGYASGLAVGALIGTNRLLHQATEPILYSLGAVPKIVLLPLLILLLGAGMGSKAGIATVSAFFPVAVATAAALQNMPRRFVDAARLLGARGPRLWLTVYTPALLGPILTGLRIGLGVGTTGVLLAESSVAQNGLGLRAIQLYSQLLVDQLYALLLLIFLVVLLLNTVLDAGIQRLTGVSSRRAVGADPFA